MRKAFRLITISLLCVILLCTVVLTACDEGDANGEGGDAPAPICQHRDMDDDSLCDKCNEPYTDGIDVHIHAWGEWSVVVSATCQSKGEEKRTCACGASETRDIAIDSSTHNAWGNWSETVAATCQSKGEEKRVCACGASETRDVAIDANAHNAWGNWSETVAATCQSKGEEKRVCACGASETRDIAIDANAHNAWGNWSETVAATCQSKGEEKRVCACGASETRDIAIDANAHNAWGNWSETVAATCQSKGEEKRVCACGASETRDIAIDANAHNAWGNWSETVAATCQTEGEEKRTCACGESETRDLATDPNAHADWSNWAQTIAPTCQTRGEEKRTCVCGESEVRDIALDANVHNAWGAWVQTIAPSATANGEEKRTCACGAFETREVFYNHTHSFGAWVQISAPTCLLKGEEKRSCSCGISETRDVEKNTENHAAFGAWAIITPATCQTKGKEKRSCACGVFETRDIEKNMENHVAFGAWGVTTPATCQAMGEEKRACACGAIETRDINKDMENHAAWSAWGVTTPATCQAKGEETRSCACGAFETRDVEKDAENHTAWSTWSVITPATCLEKGEEKRTCACGEIATRNIEKDMENHVAFGAWGVATPATCQAKGEEKRTCACGAFETCDIEKDMENHAAWSDWSVITPATCQAKGEEKRTCACGVSETRDIEKDMENHAAWSAWSVIMPATCQTKGEEKRTCACGATETQDVAINSVAHTYSATLVYNATHHYYSCACGAKKDEGVHVSSGTSNATQDEYCTVCHYVITPAVGIQFKTLAVSGNAVYGKVPNSTTQFSFINEVEMVGGAKYAVLMDINDNNPVLSKTINLAIGDNTVYILELIDDEPTNIYTVTIRRRTMYEITFDSKGGTAVESMTVEEDTILTAPTVSRTGYTFVSWDYDFAAPVFANTKITAKWSVNTYNVNYVLDGGTQNESNPTSYTIETATITLKAPARVGYTFGGWFAEETFENSVTAITLGSYGNKTFYVKWMPIEYKVSYHQTDKITTEIAYNIETPTFALMIPTRAGYTFDGWFTEETFENQVTEISLGSHGDVVLWAKWIAHTDTAYKVEYYLENADKNGYDLLRTDDLTGTTDTTATINTTFDHFTLNEAKSVLSGNINGDGSLVLSIYYTRNTYSITAAINNEKGGSVSGQGTYAYDAEVTLQAVTNAGYTFLGWYDGETKVCDDESVTLRANAAVAYVAKWEVNTNTAYKVEYYLENVDKNGYELIETFEFTAMTDTTATAEQKTFDHFTLNTAKSVLSGNVNGDDSLVLQVYYTRNTYTVSANKSSAGSISALDAHAYGKEITLTTVPYIGYQFLGYYSGDELLSAETTYTVTVEKNIEARFDVLPEMQNFNFSSTVDACCITGVKDKTVQVIVVPTYVTEIDCGAFSGFSALESITLPFVGASLNATGYQSHLGYIFGYREELQGSSSHYCDTSSSVGYKYFIPESLKNVMITDSTSVGFSAFRNCRNLTSITIPSSVKSIGSYAFYGCSSLESITIPSSVKSIGSYAFYGCSSLESITIPSSVTNIGNYAFYNCAALGEINFNATSMQDLNSDSYVFGGAGGNESKVSVNIGENVTRIPAYLFYVSSLGVVSISFPENSKCKSIGKSAFDGCVDLWEEEGGLSYIDKWVVYCDKNVTNVTVRTGTVGVLMGVFSGRALQTIAFAEGSQLTRFEEGMFEGCYNLTSIVIPDGVTFIGSSAFKDCRSLTAITLGENSELTSIGSSAFYNCNSLESIMIPSNVNSIGSLAFAYCSNLSSIMVDEKNVTYRIAGNCLIKGNAVVLGCKSSIIPSDGSITAISSEAFYGCSFLKSIVIPDSVTYIGFEAFRGCSSLASITLPFVGMSHNSNTYLGYIFGANSYDKNNTFVPQSLKTVEITTATVIGAYAFYGCKNITTVIIPRSVTKIKNYAFCNATGLNNIKYRGDRYSWIKGVETGNYWASYWSTSLGKYQPLTYSMWYEYSD